MSLLVTGSIGIDNVVSPYGSAENVLGGSAVYFSLAARPFVQARLVGVVGDDFPTDFHRLLADRGIDLRGLEMRRGSQTFRWTGEYKADMNEARTVEVDLNVLAERGPKVPSEFADSAFVFLANTHPTLQRELLAQLHSPRLVVCDTMNLWITQERESLVETLRNVDGVILNDGEVRQLTGIANLISAGEKVLEFGPRFVVVKKGESGALLLTRENVTPVPAYPTRKVSDPTGAGDSFAGGFVGYLAEQNATDEGALRRALARGTVAASFTIEDFSVRRIAAVTKREIDERVKSFISLLRLE